MSEWYARPVLFVGNIDNSVEYYVSKLGFLKIWRYDEEGIGRVAQVDREGCAIVRDPDGNELYFPYPHAPAS